MTARRRAALHVEEMETRITPVLGATELAPLVTPGTGFDGVVQITVTIGGQMFNGTGSLLSTGRHVLTSAHNFTKEGTGTVGLDGPAKVSFDLPNVGRIDIDVPVANIKLNPGYNGVDVTDDLAVMTLPALAPSGPPGLGADRYDLYRNTDEVGQAFTVVGYGTIGTGTTGQQSNATDTKRTARNRYDTLGDRVNYGGTQALLYDFDNGSAANDAFGRILGVNDLGVPGEGTSGQGDSGGPAFFQVNGKNVIAGVTTSGPGASSPENPAVLNPAVQAGFGSLSHDTRVSSFAGFIDAQTAGPAALVLDLRNQSVGQDDVADQVTVRAAGGNLELLVNGQLYHSVPLSQVTSLTLIGAGQNPPPFATTATIDATVPSALPISFERILTATDSRTATPPVVPPPGSPPVVPPPAPPGTPSQPGSGPTAPPATAPALPPTVPRGTDNAAESPRLPAPVNFETFPNLAAASKLVAAGAGAGGGPRVTVTNVQTGQKVRDFFAYEPTFTGGVTTALGDVTGDLVDDIVVGAGPGGGPRIRVFDGVTGAVVRDFFAFEPTFTGGVTVAVGDTNGDGLGDLVVGAGVGGGPRVSVFDGETLGVLQNFFAFESGQRGGVTVAAGDVNDDGVSDLVVGSGPGGGPRVGVFDGLSLAVLSNFFAFDPSMRTGVSVAAGDTDGGGAAEVIVGAGPGGAGVRTFDGRTGTRRLDLSPLPASYTGGARVAVADVNGDGLADLVVGSGVGDPLLVRTALGTTGVAGADLPGFDANFRGGVFVGGQG